jgi:Fe2+ or Zn2+ uptake regulation protein
MTLFHNTTNESGQLLMDFITKATKQNEIIKDFFAWNYHGKFTASMVHDHLAKSGYDKWPLTSVRRAMTDLAKTGILDKLEEKREGPYGRPEHFYTFRK